MTAGPRALDETIRRAIEEHGDAIDAPVPAFGSVLAGRQRHSRRMLATATAVVALVGIGGIVVATNRTQEPGMSDQRTLAEPATGEAPIDTALATASPAGTGASIATPTEFFCTNPLGEDQQGRALFGSCVPTPTEMTSDFACTDRLGTDDTGRVRFSTCVAVGQLGPLPDENDGGPFADTDDIPVRSAPYIVQRGDYGLKVAAEFCVTLGDLEAANGWIDSAREFPGPGSEILIPDGFDESTCDIGSYTVTEDDTSRIGVADKFCISVQALDAANLETDGYSGFFPGLVIVIPPSSDPDC